MELLDAYSEGGDTFVAEFEVNGVKCSFAWDAEWLLHDLSNGKSDEDMIEEYGEAA